MAKYNNITRVDFTKINRKPNINYKDIELLKKRLENQKSKISLQIKITQNLLNQNYEYFYKNIHNTQSDTIKQQLFYEKFSIVWLEWLSQFSLSDDNEKDYQPESGDIKVQDESDKTLGFLENLEQIIINPESKIQLKHNYNDKEVQNHCNSVISYLKDELVNTEDMLEVLQNIIYEMGNFKGLATPNDLRIASIGTKKPLQWLDVDDTHKEKVKELLKSTAPEILQKLEDDDNPNEIISHFIGIKLTKIELRILKTLRALVDRAFKLGEIQAYSHKVRIIRTDFHKEYGLNPRPSGGYDDNQTKKIREILFSGTSNLTKRMFFNNSKNKTVLVTAFVMKIEWEEKNNYFEIMLDDIIFVKDKSDKYSYYYEDLQGLNRLLELMPNNKSAFELHGYLEYSLKTKNHEFGLTKLLNASPTLTKRYKKDRNKTTQRLENVLDGMIKAKTLITAWKKVDGKNEIKYIFTNLHNEEDNKTDNKKITIKRRKNKTN